MKNAMTPKPPTMLMRNTSRVHVKHAHVIGNPTKKDGHESDFKPVKLTNPNDLFSEAQLETQMTIPEQIGTKGHGP